LEAQIALLDQNIGLQSEIIELINIITEGRYSSSVELLIQDIKEYIIIVVELCR